MAIMLLRKIRSQKSARYRILRERLTEPLHLNLAALTVGLCGSLRSKIDFDLVQRPHYAYGLLAAADQATDQGLKAFTAVEFGVAAGEGLLNLCSIAKRVEQATGIAVNVAGFDSGCGMPPPVDYRDHPEEFQFGDFPMDHDRLCAQLPANCELVLGPVRQTVRTFLKNVITDAPLGFAAFDLDYYTSTREALALLADSDPSKYLFLPILYFDDIVLPNYNEWAGELLAIREFNRCHELRKIEGYRFLRSRRIMKNARWIDQIFLLHLFDHPWLKRTREIRTMPNVYF
jgi:hypothetical protein